MEMFEDQWPMWLTPRPLECFQDMDSTWHSILSWHSLLKLRPIASGWSGDCRNSSLQAWAFSSARSIGCWWISGKYFSRNPSIIKGCLASGYIPCLGAARIHWLLSGRYKGLDQSQFGITLKDHPRSTGIAWDLCCNCFSAEHSPLPDPAPSLC